MRSSSTSGPSPWGTDLSVPYRYRYPTRPVPASAEPGVEVTGAGAAVVNGLYVRREAAQGPPEGFGYPEYQYLPNQRDWRHNNGGRHWYEKDDGCFIYHDQAGDWFICDSDGKRPYLSRVMQMNDAAPPAQGW